MVPNPDPKQYWNNWKNDMSLFSATNQERPYEQLLRNWLIIRSIVSEDPRDPTSKVACPRLSDCGDDAYVAVNFLFQLIFIFWLFLGRVMNANEFETKEI